MFAGNDTATDGAVVSYLKLFVELDPVFPARSDALAATVYVPSAGKLPFANVYVHAPVPLTYDVAATACEPDTNDDPFHVLPVLDCVIVTKIELAPEIPLVASVAVPAIGAPADHPATS